VLGVSVSRTAIRAVALARGRVVWAAERLLAGPEDLASGLAELAAERPRGVTRARVALEGELVQVKLLDGFPRVSAAKVRRAVALQAGRWFLRNGKPLATGATRMAGARVLAAAVELDAVDAIVAGLGEAGLGLDRVGAAAGAWAAVLPDGEHELTADHVTDRVAIVARGVASVRRSRIGEGEVITGPAVPGLAEGARFFSAYAAAVEPPSPRFDSASSDADRALAWRRHSVRLAVAAVVLWAAAAVAFGMRVSAATRQAALERAALGPALDAAMAVERDLALTNEVLGAVDAALHTRSTDARLLSVLTAALPDSAHLLALRRNRDGQVTLVGYAPAAARVLAALAATPGVVQPALQSGITRETVAGRSRERFAIAFAWQPPPVAP
jgi:hypothetical protein